MSARSPSRQTRGSPRSRSPRYTGPEPQRPEDCPEGTMYRSAHTRRFLDQQIRVPATCVQAQFIQSARRLSELTQLSVPEAARVLSPYWREALENPELSESVISRALEDPVIGRARELKESLAQSRAQSRRQSRQSGYQSPPPLPLSPPPPLRTAPPRRSPPPIPLSPPPRIPPQYLQEQSDDEEVEEALSTLARRGRGGCGYAY